MEYRVIEHHVYDVPQEAIDKAKELIAQGKYESIGQALATMFAEGHESTINADEIDVRFECEEA